MRYTVVLNNHFQPNKTEEEGSFLYNLSSSTCVATSSTMCVPTNFCSMVKRRKFRLLQITSSSFNSWLVSSVFATASLTEIFSISSVKHVPPYSTSFPLAQKQRDFGLLIAALLLSFILNEQAAMITIYTCVVISHCIAPSNRGGLGLFFLCLIQFPSQHYAILLISRNSAEYFSYRLPLSFKFNHGYPVYICVCVLYIYM